MLWELPICVPDLVILTEAGGTIGYGHLMRCQAIADCVDAKLYVHADGDYPKSNNTITYAWRAHPSLLIKNLSNRCPVLIDSYMADSNTYKYFSNYFEYVCVIDDYERLIYPAELLINPGIKLPDYKDQKTKVVGGNEYIILRKEIIQHLQKIDYDEYQSLLITFGGCDASKLFEWLIPLLDKFHLFNIVIVTGNSKTCVKLSKKYDSSSIKWLGQVDGYEMADLMYQSDLCISAGGQTLHELAYIGVPTICIETGSDQINNIEGYIELGFLMEKLSLQSQNLSEKINSSLNKYSSKSLRQKTAGKGKFSIDGKGATRIAKLLTRTDIPN